MSKTHKFFDVHLDNDIDSLYAYLENKMEELLSGNLVSIPQEKLSQYNKDNGAPTQLGNYYNIFQFDNNEIKALHNALRDLVKDASEYYGHDFNEKQYKINGWFNYDPKTQGGSGVNPLKNDIFFHDHAEGLGAPIFHGYYCVNAEPSITYYKIDGETLFENYNKNNRVIVSETGHPHGRDDWYEDKPRITIAYDIAPKNSHVVTNMWVEL